MYTKIWIWKHVRHRRQLDEEAVIWLSTNYSAATTSEIGQTQIRAGGGVAASASTKGITKAAHEMDKVSHLEQEMIVYRKQVHAKFYIGVINLKFKNLNREKQINTVLYQ